MAEAEPLDDGVAFSIAAGLAQDFLLSVRSGELVALKGRGSLVVDEDASAAFVSCTVGPSLWCRNATKWRCMEVTETGEVFFFNKDTGASVWESDLHQGASETKGLSVHTAMAKVDIICYVSELRKLRRRLRWSLPHIADLAVGSGFDGRWISRHSKQLIGAFEDAGLDANHLVRSMWSVTYTGSKNERADLAEAYEDEFNVSSEGLIESLLYFTVGRVKSKGVVDAPTVVACFLNGLARKLLPASGCPWQVCFGDGEFAELVLRDGRIVVRDVHKKKWAQIVQTLVRTGDIGTILVHLAQTLRRPKRIPSYCHIAQAMFKDLEQRLATSLEGTVGSAVWDETRPSDIPALYKTGSEKARRVGIGYVLDVVNAVSTSPELRTPAQLLASKCTSFSKESRGKRAKIKFATARRCLRPISGHNFISKKMCCYQDTLKEKLRCASHLSVALDGTRAGGADWCLYAATDPSSGIAGWWPPQVPVGFQRPPNGMPKTQFLKHFEGLWGCSRSSFNPAPTKILGVSRVSHSSFNPAPLKTRYPKRVFEILFGASHSSFNPAPSARRLTRHLRKTMALARNPLGKRRTSSVFVGSIN